MGAAGHAQGKGAPWVIHKADILTKLVHVPEGWGSVGTFSGVGVNDGHHFFLVDFVLFCLYLASPRLEGASSDTVH